MRKTRRLKKGDRVAHLTLDNRDGTAKCGIVEDTVGDDEQTLVIGRFDDSPTPEAYDSREVEKLLTIPGLGRGPVLLYPRHLWRLLTRPFRRGA